MDLYDAGTVIGDALPSLDQALSAFALTLEAMEDGRISAGEEMSASLALAARLPMYLDTLHLILRDMENTFSSLQAGTDRIFEASEVQRGKEGTAASGTRIARRAGT